MRRRGDGSEAIWGFLLPLQDGPPPLELRLDTVSVGSHDRCTLHVDAAVFGLSPAAAPQVVFEVHRERASTLLRSRSDVLWVNGKLLRRGREGELLQGSRISFESNAATYVFVNREESESFNAPQDVLKKYLVGHCLGGGGFGKVYLLFDKKLDYQRTAMKIVEPRNEKQVKYAAREGRILKSLKHPCVITMYSIEHLGQQQFLVMEYLAGGDLTQFVNEQRLLSEAQTKLLFFQLALAVQYLHKKNICHRDLKPDNILLQRRDPQTLIKVTDFGLAKDDEDHSSLKTFAGTRPYLAPEIINGKYTNAVDVWSMGVILFYSLTGELPFKTLNEAMSRGHNVKFDPERWRDVSCQSRMLVSAMLKVRVTARMSVSEVLEDPWLRDDAMRQDAFQLTGLEAVRPRPLSRPPASAPAPKAAPPPTHRVLSGPRGVLEYMKLDTDPTLDQEVRRGCLESLRARPLCLAAVILVVIIIIAFITYGLWIYVTTDVV